MTRDAFAELCQARDTLLRVQAAAMPLPWVRAWPGGNTRRDQIDIHGGGHAGYEDIDRGDADSMVFHVSDIGPVVLDILNAGVFRSSGDPALWPAETYADALRLAEAINQSRISQDAGEVR